MENIAKQIDVFGVLNAVNVNDHAEKKSGQTYLSWAWAWAEVKKAFPAAAYTIYENAQGWNYHTDGRTCWVKTGVTIEGLEHIEYLPVMDFRNASIPLERVTSYDVNKAIQRSLTKACARHGLGLYIYAGEDLPEGEQPPQQPEPPAPPQPQPTQPQPQPQPIVCNDCGRWVSDCTIGGKRYSAQHIAANAQQKYGRVLCAECSKRAAYNENKGVNENA